MTTPITSSHDYPYHIGVNTLRASQQEEYIKMGEERESLEEMVDSLMDLSQTEERMLI